jgi:4-amino-4-deoxy-L-arabinose transferase-like glycosyltransferase
MFEKTRIQRWSLWLLPLLLLVLAVWRPLSIPDEGRYAEIGRWMLVSGDWITPRIDGIAFFHKPPLLYWLEALSLSVFGVSPWAARCVVVLQAWVMWAVLYNCAKFFAGAEIARRATWMLGSSMAFLVAGQYVNHDMMVATWIGVTIWCFARAFLHSGEVSGASVHAGWARAGFVASALGVLSKGLIGLALPGLVLLIWIAYTAQWKKILALPWVSGVSLFVAISVPWFVLAEGAYPGMLNYMFGTQQFARYTQTEFNNAQPWWFYLAAIALLMFPWVFVVLAQGVEGAWTRWIKRSALHSNQNAVDPVIALCWIWLVAVLGFFSIPSSKIIGYALPVMPALAYLAATWWQRHWAHKRWAQILFTVLVAGASLLAVVLNHKAGQFTQERGIGQMADVVACAIEPNEPLAVIDDYPYDLPFYAKRNQTLEVIQDWAHERKVAADDWRRELFEGADFDPQPGHLALQPLSRLEALKADPNAWLLAPKAVGAYSKGAHEGFDVAFETAAWVLYRPSVAATKSPVSAQNERLRRCKNQSENQR